MDVPSTASGVIEKVHVSKGGTVSPGDLIVTVRAAAADPAAAGAAKSDGAPAPAAASETSAKLPESAPAAAKAPAATPPPPTPVTPAASKPAPAAAPSAAPGPAAKTDLPPINEVGFSQAHAGPSVRKFAREIGVDLSRVKGSGFKGRITHDDVKGFVKSSLTKPAPAAARAPAVAEAVCPSFRPSTSRCSVRWKRSAVADSKDFGPAFARELGQHPARHTVRRRRYHRSRGHADKLKEKASQAGIKLTPLAFIVRACVRALQNFRSSTPRSIRAEKTHSQKYFNVGFAADTPNGLVVPVVRDANRKDVYEIARNLGELSEKGRAGKLSPDDMQGGCFTISSLGGIGGTAFTPIINAPEVAILGVSRSAMKPVYRDGTFVPRLILPLSLSYDHRVIDGATAARFTTFLAESLANVAGLLEAVHESRRPDCS